MAIKSVGGGRRLAGAGAAAGDVWRATLLTVALSQMMVHLTTLHCAPGARGRPGAAAAISSTPLAASKREFWRLEGQCRWAVRLAYGVTRDALRVNRV